MARSCVLPRDRIGSLSLGFPTSEDFWERAPSLSEVGRIEDLSISLEMLPGIVGYTAMTFDGSQRLRVQQVGSANIELTWLLRP